jgi:CBS-domain-containing membrane protein
MVKFPTTQHVRSHGVSDPPTQSDVQAVANKVDEMINAQRRQVERALRRAGSLRSRRLEATACLPIRNPTCPPPCAGGCRGELV